MYITQVQVVHHSGTQHGMIHNSRNISSYTNFYQRNVKKSLFQHMDKANEKE